MGWSMIAAVLATLWGVVQALAIPVGVVLLGAAARVAYLVARESRRCQGCWRPWAVFAAHVPWSPRHEQVALCWRCRIRHSPASATTPTRTHTAVTVRRDAEGAAV
jgi:hypothetical protein